MSVDLNRQELYDLVWSTPIMHAAKQFGISGSMLGRICEQRNVPRPPRGYWANLQATSIKKVGRFTKPPLPNLPEPNRNFNNLMRREYADREANRTDDFDPKDLNDPIRPPPPPANESMKEFEQRIDELFPDLPDPETIKTRHPIVQTVYDFDLTLVALKKRGGWERPDYQDEKGKMCLNWLNVLIHSFEALGFEVILRGRKHFSFQLNFLGHHKEFVFFINEKNPTLVQRKYHKQVPSKTYCFRWDNETEKYAKGRTYYEFESMTTQAIKQIVMDVVIRDESDYRSRVVTNYEWKVDRRKHEIEWRQSQLQEAAEKKRKALVQLLANRETLMTSAVEGMNHADQVRELIEIMQAKSQAAQKPIKDFDRWVRWATHHANTLDPRYMSVQGFEAWVGKFKLKH